MGNIRKWGASAESSYKGKKPSQEKINILLEQINREISSKEPDYQGCADILMSFHYQYMGNFFEKLYGTFSKSTQLLLNTAISDSIKTTPNPRNGTMKIALVIAWRLKQVKTGNELAPELQCYISNYIESYMISELQSIRDNCTEAALQKLLSIDIQEWEVSMSRVKAFFHLLFGDSTDKETKKMYQKFLADNYLNDSSALNAIETVKTPPAGTQPSRDSLSADVPQKGAVESAAVEELSANTTATEESVSPVDSFSCEQESPVLASEIIPPTSAPKVAAADALSPVLQRDSAEQELERNGVKLAELLLVWCKKQANSTATLKESLKASEREYKRLDTQFTKLREELFTVKKELAERDAAVGALELELKAEKEQLAASGMQVAELDETIQKLQRMNENSAFQAVAGYKADLAAALKSIVEDARLPEAQRDADILSALLGDLLDTLRFKGVPLEVTE